MKTIWKFPVGMDAFELEMPADAKVLSCAMQAGAAVMWAMVDPNASKTIRKFRIVGTGQPISDDLGLERFVGTLVMEKMGLVFHLFEVRS